MTRQITSNLAKLAFGALLLAAPSVKAAALTFHVDLNTAALTTAPNGPFFLDFEFAEGTGTVPNTVTISHFSLTGGTPSGTPFITGNAAGDMSNSITLTVNPSNQFDEVFQGFTAGTTDIQFDVSVSQNAPGASPDEFKAAILDSEPGNPQIGTSAPDSVSLVTLSITASNTLSDVGTYSSTSPTGVTASAIPEPSTMVALFGGVAMLLGFRRKRN